jgi:hypothetical protein
MRNSSLVVIASLSLLLVACGSSLGGIGTDDDLGDGGVDRSDAHDNSDAPSLHDTRAPSSGDAPPGSDAPSPPPPIDSGSIATDSGGTAPDTATSDDLQHCVDVLNSYRAKVGRPPLARASDLEAYATVGAKSDSETGEPHGHFMSTDGGGIAWAENEIPGWPLVDYGSVRDVIDEGTKMMWDEGPGGGHYENIVGDYTQVGCGTYLTPGGDVWITQDFR